MFTCIFPPHCMSKTIHPLESNIKKGSITLGWDCLYTYPQTVWGTKLASVLHTCTVYRGMQDQWKAYTYVYNLHIYTNNWAIEKQTVKIFWLNSYSYKRWDNYCDVTQRKKNNGDDSVTLHNITILYCFWGYCASLWVNTAYHSSDLINALVSANVCLQLCMCIKTSHP